MAAGGMAEATEAGVGVVGAVEVGVTVVAGADMDMAGAGPDIMPGGVTLDTTTRTIMAMATADPTGAATAIPMARTAIGGAATIIAVATEAAPTVDTWSTAPIIID